MTPGILINGRKREDLLAKRLEEVADRRKRDTEEQIQREAEASSKNREPKVSQTKKPSKARKRASSIGSPNPVLPVPPQVITPTADLGDLSYLEILEPSQSWPAAVDDTRKMVQGLDYVLWSAAEVAKLRLSGKKIESELHCVTRTTAFYYIEDGNCYAAFDDARSESENIILQQAAQGYLSYQNSGTWLMPKTDPIIARTLARAQTAGRIIQVSEIVYERKTKTGPLATFGGDGLNRAIFGIDLSESYSIWLKTNQKQDYGYIRSIGWIKFKEKKEELNLDPEFVQISGVALGGSDSYGLNYILSGVGLNSTGCRACGVAIKPHILPGGASP